MAGAPRMPLRMLFIAADKFPPFRVDVAELFGRELAGRGHTIDWVLQAEGPGQRVGSTEWSGGRARVGRTDLGTSRAARLHKHWLALRNDFAALRLIRREAYDLVQVKDKFVVAPFAALAARRCGTPFVYWLSFPFPEESLYLARKGKARYPLLYRLRGHVIGFLLYRVILPLAEHVFVQSEQMREDLVRRGVAREKMTPVPMGVSVTDLAETRALVGAAGAPAGARHRIAYLGTLGQARHIDFLVRVLAHLLRRGRDAELLLVGDGDGPKDRTLLLDEARRLGVEERLTITGFLPRREALARVAEADLCLSPFYPTPILNSTSPTKLVEYMALGRPVVANDHPEQRRVLAESGAGLCVAWDEEAFAAAAAAILDDPEEGRAMGRRGRAWVERQRAYPHIADAVEDEYRRLLERHRAYRQGVDRGRDTAAVGRET